jgi:hypothetical protein
MTLTPTLTGTEFDEIVELKRKPTMKSLELVKVILEIAAIFLTFPEYAPLLAVVVAVGAAYSLVKRTKKKEDASIPNVSEVTEQCPVAKELPSSEA